MTSFKITHIYHSERRCDFAVDDHILYVRGICIDQKGCIWTSETENKKSRITIIRGEQVSNLITKGKVALQYPFGVCVGKNDTIYFADMNKHTIYKVNDGKAILHAGMPSKSGTKDGPLGTLSSPTGIVEGENGDLYIVCFDSGSIRKMSKHGYLSTICTGLRSPYGITKDSSGNLYVAELAGHCVTKVDNKGGTTLVVPQGELHGPVGLAFDLFGNLLVCEHHSGNVKRISSEGKVSLLSFTDQVGNPYHFSYPIDMAVDVTGVYITEKRGITKIEMPIKWSTSMHSKFYIQTRIQIKTLLLLTNRKTPFRRIPRDIWLIIIKFVAT